MGQARAMCLAIVAIAEVGVAASPRLGRWLCRRRSSASRPPASSRRRSACRNTRWRINGNASTLETAQPFDREFIDMMIPHHQGAIRMARVVRAIEIVAVTPEDGVTAAARVRLQLNGERDRTLHLVQFRGLWRVVIPLPTGE